jgi:hypothetical protein
VGPITYEPGRARLIGETPLVKRRGRRSSTARAWLLLAGQSAMREKRRHKARAFAGSCDMSGRGGVAFAHLDTAAALNDLHRRVADGARPQVLWGCRKGGTAGTGRGLGGEVPGRWALLAGATRGLAQLACRRAATPGWCCGAGAWPLLPQAAAPGGPPAIGRAPGGAQTRRRRACSSTLGSSPAPRQRTWGQSGGCRVGATAVRPTGDCPCACSHSSSQAPLPHLQ